MYQLRFELPGLPKTVNAMTGMHWKKKGEHVKYWHRAVWIAVGKHRPVSPLQKAKLELVRHSSVQPDYDGLVSSFKPVIDGLIRCGVIADDKYLNIGESRYRWDKAPQKRGRIEVSVEEIA